MCIDELRSCKKQSDRDKQGASGNRDALRENGTCRFEKLLCAGYGYARNPNRKFCGGHFYGDRDH